MRKRIWNFVTTIIICAVVVYLSTVPGWVPSFWRYFLVAGGTILILHGASFLFARFVPPRIKAIFDTPRGFFLVLLATVVLLVALYSVKGRLDEGPARTTQTMNLNFDPPAFPPLENGSVMIEKGQRILLSSIPTKNVLRVVVIDSDGQKFNEAWDMVNENGKLRMIAPATTHAALKKEAK